MPAWRARPAFCAAHDVTAREPIKRPEGRSLTKLLAAAKFG
jgi:hypothetical protein